MIISILFPAIARPTLPRMRKVLKRPLMRASLISGWPRLLPLGISGANPVPSGDAASVACECIVALPPALDTSGRTVY